MNNCEFKTLSFITKASKVFFHIGTEGKMSPPLGSSNPILANVTFEHLEF